MEGMSEIRPKITLRDSHGLLQGQPGEGIPEGEGRCRKCKKSLTQIEYFLGGVCDRCIKRGRLECLGR